MPNLGRPLTGPVVFPYRQESCGKYNKLINNDLN